MDQSETSSPNEDGQQGAGTFPVTRKQLYMQVWAEPMLKVAERYKVSSSFLARVCGEMNVPRPPRGYWAKLAVGIVSKQPSLPEPGAGDLLEWGRGGMPKRHFVAQPKPPKSTRRPVRSADERPSMHHLINGAKALFEAGRETDIGFLKPSKKLLPDLVVTKGTLSRALEVANELFLALEDRGYSVILAPSSEGYTPRAEFDEREKGGDKRHYSDLWGPMRPTLAYLGTVAIGITIFEMTEQVEVRWKDGKYVRMSELSTPKRSRYSHQNAGWTSQRDLPSGRLCIQAYSPYSRTEWKHQWRESTAGDISEKLSALVKHMAREAPTIANLVEIARQQAEVERKRWEEQMEKHRRDEEERQRQKAIKDSHVSLLSIIEAWAEHKRIEGFFQEVKDTADLLSEEVRADVLNRLSEAQRLIGVSGALDRLLNWQTPEERLGKPN